MADVTQNVIIEFISDTSKLEPGIDRLEKMGKVEAEQANAFKTTNAEINKQAAALKQVAAINDQITSTGKVTKKNLSDLAALVKGMSGSFQKEFKAGVIEALKQAGISVKEFEKILDGSFDKSEKSALSLKGQLRQMTEQLAQMKVNGQENSKEFVELAAKAGKLKDAIADAGQEVKNFASDTSTFDGLISAVQGLAGGFAVVQGAEALFGDESEELQKTLLRVNAAMAILQGLQQIQITLQKESAASQLLNTIATKAQTGALALYNFVVGASTGLTKAFRIALASTGVGLLVLGLVELVKILNKTDNSLEKANQEIEHQKNLIEGLNEVIQRRIDLETSRARAAGAAESEITRIQGKGLLAQRKALVESQQDLIKQQSTLKETSEAWFKLNDQITANGEALKALDTDIVVKNIELQKQLAEESLQALVDLAEARSAAAKKNSKEDFAAQKALEIAKANLAIEVAGQNNAKIAAIRAELNKKLREIDRAAREQEQRDILADIETRLLKAQAKSKAVNERITQEEINLQKELILKKAQFESEQEGLSQQQILEIKTKALTEANKLQKEFSKQANKEILDDAISRNNAELQKVGLTEKEKLSFQIDNIILSAQQEIEANEGLSEKIKEINAKRDRDIKEARLASIKATLELELAMSEADNAPILRNIQKQLDAQERLRSAQSRSERRRLEDQFGIKKLTAAEEINLITKVTAIALDANFKRIQALNEERRLGLISQEEYNLEYKRLIEEQTKIVEEGEQKKNETIQKSQAERIANLKTDIDNTLKVAELARDILSGINDIQSQKENERLSAERQRIKDLQDAGAITEKEAIQRMKRVDLEERKIKQQQAKRDKEIALFNAVINTARGVAAAIPNPFLIALAIAVGAAQIAIIAAKPLPKFAGGKKNSYEGLAEVGEAGSELIEQNGKMYVAEKPQVVWLGKSDKVYSHKETVEMMTKPVMSTERNGAVVAGNKVLTIDYEKMGEAIGKHVQTNVFVDGVQEQAIRKKEFITYLNNRRSF